MTEIDWLAGADPRPMLVHILGRSSDRRLRLFAVACCRRVPEANDPAALDAAERFADGTAGESELRTAHTGTRHPAMIERAGKAAGIGAAVAAAARADAGGDLSHPQGAGDAFAAELGERRAQARLLREIFGNPFRPVAFDPRWRAADAVALARGIYADRAFDRLPLLADALMDAGCADERVIGHCRSEGPHARGCWVVDLVLGKE